MPSVNFHRLVGFRCSLNWIGLFGVLFWLCSCKPRLSNIEPAYRRGLGENPTRTKFGMRAIQASWICFRSANGQDEWLIDSKKDTLAVKVVKHGVDESLLWETDSYLSGHVVMKDDNKFAEEIKLHLDYSTGQLRLIYLGNDKEIIRWIEADGTNSPGCLMVIKRVRAKWFGEGAG